MNLCLALQVTVTCDVCGVQNILADRVLEPKTVSYRCSCETVIEAEIPADAFQTGSLWIARHVVPPAPQASLDAA